MVIEVRGHRGLVPVKKQVTTKGKVRTITYWIKPKRKEKKETLTEIFKKKKPWQMTFKEIMDLPKYPLSYADQIDIATLKKTPEQVMREYHKRNIELAFEMNKRVSLEVLKEYPELKKKSRKKEYKLKKEVKEKKKDILKEIPVKGLNKGIDFKANEKFLNEEIEGMEPKAISSEALRIAKVEVLTLEKIVPSTEKKKEYDADLKNKRDELKRLENIQTKSGKEKYLKSFEDFTQNLTPVHSLSVDKFLRVLKSGGLKALEELEESSKQAGYAIIESEIRPGYGDAAARIVYKMVSDDDYTFTDKEVKELKESGLKEYTINAFDYHLEKVKENIRELKEGAVGYSVDKEIGTDKHVFAIMGPNGDGSGYGEISIVLKQDIMDHPDFNMTPVAGTSFYSGEMYEHRTWAKDTEVFDIDDLLPEEQEEFQEDSKTFTSKKHFHKSKLNKKENPEYYKYMAKDIAAQGSIDDYLERGSHGKWEGHLPAEVPTSQFAEVVMPKYILSKIAHQQMMLEAKKIREKYEKLYSKSKEYKELFTTWDRMTGQSDDKNIKVFKGKFKDIKIVTVDDSSDILPYMNEGFKSEKWRRK